MRINPKKMGFWRAKQGLSKTWNLKTKIGLMFRRELKNGWEKERRRGRGREEEVQARPTRYGTLDFCMELHGIRKFV